MPKRLASLSLDLDNKWSYLKTSGDEGWESLPTYLPQVIPRILDFLAKRDLKITFFVVGQDADVAENVPALRTLADAGHEIANHSYHHEPWLHLYSAEELTQELDRAEAAIHSATGQKSIGFRGPGFSFSPAVLQELADRGYRYDASTFPTFLGPVARMYFFFTSKLSRTERAQRKELFGHWNEGLRPLRPHFWKDIRGQLLEIPVTTMPLLKVPIHATYLLYLAEYSQGLALLYFRMALMMCRVFRVEPSLLLHPLDFLGCDDEPDLAFFPAMKSKSSSKLEFMGQIIDRLAASHTVVPMREHADAYLASDL